MYMDDKCPVCRVDTILADCLECIIRVPAPKRTAEVLDRSGEPTQQTRRRRAVYRDVYAHSEELSRKKSTRFSRSVKTMGVWLSRPTVPVPTIPTVLETTPATVASAILVQSIVRMHLATKRAAQLFYGRHML
jgi:hypothetical protein